MAASHSGLYPLLEEGEDAGQAPVDKGGDRECLEGVSLCASDLSCPIEELRRPGESNQRGVLEHRDELVPGRGDYHSDRLRQDDAAGRLWARHRQRVRRLDLAVANRLDARSKYLRHVGAVVDT